MCGCQNNTSIDMLMYYDARPCSYNGLFDYYTNELLKGYYPFKMFNTLYTLGTACECVSDNKNVYATAAKGTDGTALMFSYYNDDDDCDERCEILFDFNGATDAYEIFSLDKERDAESIGFIKSGEKIKVYPNTVCLLKSV